MQSTRVLKKFIEFQKRELDWWFFTLLPIILILSIGFFVYSTFGQLNEILILLSKQFLSYSVVLSSADLGLKSKIRGDTQYQISPPLLIIIIALMSLMYLYTNNEITKSFFWIFFYLIVSVFFAYFSILLYNNDPYSSNIGPKIFTENKEKDEEEAKRLFESPKTESKLKVKWGE